MGQGVEGRPYLGVPSRRGAFTPSTRLVSIERPRRAAQVLVEFEELLAQDYDETEDAFDDPFEKCSIKHW